MTLVPRRNQWLAMPARRRIRRPGVLASAVGRLLSRTAAKRPFDAGTTEYFYRQQATASDAWEYYEQFIGTSVTPLRILDVGCGAGARTSAHAAKANASFYCVDLDFALMREGASRSSSDSIVGRRFAQADATNLPFADDTFDVCLCENVLEHFERPDLAIAELARVLGPGGHIFALFPPWRGPSSGHLTYFTSLPWIHLLPASVIVRILVAIHYPRLLADRRPWPQSAVSMVEHLGGHLNGWSLRSILGAINECPDLQMVDAYALGEWQASRALRFLPWLGEFFANLIYLVYQKTSDRGHRVGRLKTYNGIVRQMIRRHLRQFR